jgi:heme/copper-type cytochrome/quinol oxidase subunit 2
MARRLLVPVTLLFLALLVLGALTTPDSTRRDSSSTPLPPPAGDPPRTVEGRLPAGDDEIEARVGDLVTLTVESKTVGGVEVPGFGVSEPVAPESPATFDLLPTQAGRFPVRAVETGSQIGVLVVEDES